MINRLRSHSSSIALLLAFALMLCLQGDIFAQPGSSPNSSGKRGMLRDVNKQISSLEGRITTLETSISTSGDQSDALMKKINEKKEELDELKSQLAGIRQELDKTQKQLLEELLADTDLGEKEKKLVADGRDLNDLRVKLLAPIHSKYKFRQLIKKKKQLQEDIEFAREEGDFKKVGEMSTAILELDQQIEAYEEKALMKNTKYARLHKKHESLAKEVREDRAKIDKVINEDPVVQQLNGEIKDIEGSIKSASASNLELLNDRRKVVTTASRAKSEIPRLKSQVAKLKVKKKQIETALAHDQVIPN